MVITVQLPDDIALHGDAQREALEALAIEAYRSGSLSHHQAASLLRMSRMQFEQLLSQRGIEEHAYGVDDLENDLHNLERLRDQGLLAS